MMKRIIIIVFMIAGVASADTGDGTRADIATSILKQVNFDTTGNDLVGRSLAMEYAGDGIDKAGWDIGIEVSKPCTSTAGEMGMLVDTALINVVSVIYDSSSGYPVRALVEVPVESLNTKQFSGEVAAGKNATHYSIWGDSLLLLPVSKDADVFTVRYWERVDHLSDSTTGTNLSQEYRDLAVLWGCYKISERANNGRADEFKKRYYEEIDNVWRRRVNKTTAGKLK